MCVTHKDDLRRYLESEGLRNPPSRAVEAVREGRVVDVSAGGLTLTLFKSKERDYLIVPKTYCSCRDFEFNVLLRGKRAACYHLVAESLARVGGSVKRVDIGDRDELYAILVEILYTSRSGALRRALLQLRK